MVDKKNVIFIGVLQNIKDELMINEIENRPRIAEVQKIIDHFTPIPTIYSGDVRTCPICGGRIVYADQKYCDECGQAIKL